MRRALKCARMFAGCLATIVMFATAAPGVICRNKQLARLSRRFEELGARAGNVSQHMDENAERIDDCLYGVKRCRSPRLKGVRGGLDKFNNRLDRVWNAFDKAGDALQDGIVTK